MKKIHAPSKFFNWGIFSFKTIDIFLFVLFISTIKFFVDNKIEYAIFCVSLMIWNEIHKNNRINDVA
ncbi:MAG: hypothetical protein ABF649_00795 [Bacillus sp. (in: firmicutes)]